jgi:hypothetical protein
MSSTWRTAAFAEDADVVYVMEPPAWRTFTR